MASSNGIKEYIGEGAKCPDTVCGGVPSQTLTMSTAIAPDSGIKSVPKGLANNRSSSIPIG